MAEKIIEESVFKREVALCRKLSQERKGCNWGKCKDCGVIPLLYKLNRGISLEDNKDIAGLKSEYLR